MTALTDKLAEIDSKRAIANLVIAGDAAGSPAGTLAAQLQAVVDTNNTLMATASGATKVGFTPSGNVSSTNVAGALTQIIANRKRGTFTCSAAATTTVADTSIQAASVVVLMPTNAAAATLIGSAKSLYVSARTVGVSFAVTTANGAAAAGTEAFEYELLN